jgi:hypothetical protein
MSLQVKFHRTTVLSKILHVSLVYILPDGDLHQVEKDTESTFLPDVDLHQVEMIGISQSMLAQ